MATAPGERIPLVVVGGFLGAGKTTLVNHWLAEAGQPPAGQPARRLAVLVNDFGALDIDAELVRAAGGDTIALGNGCVCCQIGDDLSAALLQVLQRPETFDAVVVEASGVSDPWRIAQIALAEPTLALGGVVVVVDASAVLAHAADPLLADTLARQLDAADLLLVNKGDRVDAAERAAVEGWLDAHAPAVPRVATRDARLPLDWIDGRLGRGHPHAHAHAYEHEHEHENDHGSHAHAHPHEHAHDDPHHGNLFEGWSARPGGRYSATALKAALREMPTGVLRLKGLLPTDSLGWCEWQFAGRHGSLRRALAEPAAGAGVVAIGLRGRLPKAALEALLARCLISG